MLQSINKYKIYLYFIFFIFFSSIFNFKFIESYQNQFSLKKINIKGLSNSEKKIIKNELDHFKNVNIFKLKKEKVLEKLNKFNFLENIYIDKIIPSSINIKLSKTPILGETLINGEKFYIGKNGKLINSHQLIDIDKMPTVFGNFQIKDYLNLLDILKNSNLDLGKIDKYYFYKNKRWDIFFSSGLTLMLPSKNFEDSVKIFKKLLENKILINTEIIDLRVKDQIILTTKNE